MDFLHQKEEIENKIKNINNYWEDLTVKQQEKLKKVGRPITGGLPKDPV